MMHWVSALALVLVLASGGAPAAQGQAPVVTPKELKQSDATAGWEFSYRYPQLSVPGALMGVRGICEDFNQRMEQEARQSLEGFKKEVAVMV